MVREQLTLTHSRPFTHAPPSARQRTALHLACAEGHTDVAEFLLSKGAEINAPDRFNHTPLNDAVSNRHNELVKVRTLIDRAISPALSPVCVVCGFHVCQSAFG